MILPVRAISAERVRPTSAFRPGPSSVARLRCVQVWSPIAPRPASARSAPRHHASRSPTRKNVPRAPARRSVRVTARRVGTGPVVERERDQPRSSVAAVDRYAAAGEAIDGELAGGSRAPAVHKWVRGGGAGRRQREGHGEEQDPHAWDTSPDAEGA